MKQLLHNLMSESSCISIESYHEGIPDAVLAEYDILEPAGLLDIPKEFMEKVAAIGDESPKYVTWAMPSGFSRYMEPESVGNDDEPKNPHRFWPEEVIFDFAEQIRARSGVAGYGGHAGFFDGSSIPENIPVLWVSAVKARRKNDNRGVTLAQGYVTRQGNYRENITLGIIDSASVSTVGTTKRKTREKDDKEYEEVQKGAALLSFDLVRKDTHGVPGTRLVANLANEGSHMDNLTPEMKEFLAGLTREQLATYNPALLEAIRVEKSDVLGMEATERMKILIDENVTSSYDVALVKKLTEVFNCEVATLVEFATNIVNAQASIIEQSIDAATKGIKNDKLREQVKATVIAAKPSSVEKAAELVNLELSKLQNMIEMLASEKGLGSVPFTLQSEGQRFGGSSPIASFLTEGAKL